MNLIEFISLTILGVSVGLVDNVIGRIKGDCYCLLRVCLRLSTYIIAVSVMIYIYKSQR